MKESQDDSPTQTSRHIFSKLLNAISENLTTNDMTQHVKQGLQKILAWFIIDYFAHIIDLIEQARKTFRTQNTDEETILAKQTNYVWDPEWSHELCIIMPTDISSQAISTISIHKDFVRVNPLIIDATRLNYNSVFLKEQEKNSLNFSFKTQANLNETRKLTYKIYKPHHIS